MLRVSFISLTTACFIYVYSVIVNNKDLWNTFEAEMFMVYGLSQ